MHVRVRLFDTLRKFAPKDAANGEFVMKLGSGATVKDLLKICGLNEDSVTVAMVNGMIAHLGAIINDQDEISIFPPLVGD